MSSDSAPPGFNYATYFGIDHVAPAAIFAALYVALLGYFAFRALRQPTYVFITLTIFCAIRLTAFIIRALLAGSASAGQNLNLYIADNVLFSVGFIGLLYPSYILVLDRELLLHSGENQRLLSKIMQNRRVMRIIMIAGVACGITGINYVVSGTEPSTIKTGDALLKAGAGIYFAVTCIQGIFAVIYTKHELQAAKDGDSNSDKALPFGATHGGFILIGISVFLLIREGFAVGTVGNLTKSGQEDLWFPLVALPELLAVICYGIPGLVPNCSQVNEAQEDSKA